MKCSGCYSRMTTGEKHWEQIIGNGFNESSLDEEEREVLYHFYQQGHKTLWLILTLIEGPKSQTFDRIKSRDLKNEKISILGRT